MIENEELGLVIAENEEEALLFKAKEATEKRIKELQEAYYFETLVLEATKDRLKKIEAK
jgi:hypothetical protein